MSWFIRVCLDRSYRYHISTNPSETGSEVGKRKEEKSGTKSHRLMAAAQLILLPPALARHNLFIWKVQYWRNLELAHIRRTGNCRVVVKGTMMNVAL